MTSSATSTASSLRMTFQPERLATAIMAGGLVLDRANLFHLFPAQMEQAQRMVDRMGSYLTLSAGFPDFARGIAAVFLSAHFGPKAGDFAHPGPLLKLQKSHAAYDAAMAFMCGALGVTPPKRAKR